MGKSSRPLHIIVDQALYDANPPQWQALIEQGYIIQILIQPTPDLYLASHAMRMTGDMLIQLPAALDLAIKGARDLRYGTTTKGAKAWKGAKGAKEKVTRKGAHVEVKVEAPITGELPPPQTNTGIGGEPINPTSDGGNYAGPHYTG